MATVRLLKTVVNGDGIRFTPRVCLWKRIYRWMGKDGRGWVSVSFSFDPLLTVLRQRSS
jgi:hypothetical protein